MVSCRPLDLDIPENNLPHEAFDWGFKKGMADCEPGKTASAVLGIQIVVPKVFLA